MTLCSVIIPVYNTKEEYLRRCLNCFIKAGEDIEVIAVNDGSTNGSETILTEYQHLIQNYRILEQTNSGVSAARNTGLTYAQGEWIIFCDADDEADTEILSKLITNADTDFVYADFRKIRRKESIITFPDITSPDEYIHQLMCHPNQYGTVWSKLYRRSIIEKKHIRFREELTHAEDTVFLLEYLMGSKKISHSSEPFYTYRFYPASASKTNTEAGNKYIRSMEKIREIYLNEYYGDIRDYGSYCNTNLMIILANYVYAKGKKYSQSKKELGELLDRNVISSSLQQYNEKETDWKQKVAIAALDKKLYGMVWLIVTAYKISK